MKMALAVTRHTLVFLVLQACAAASLWAAPGGSPREDPGGNPGVTPGALRYEATLHSIGFEWDVVGDTNHNAVCSVRYRPEGASQWQDALGLLRIDYAWYYNERKAEQPQNMMAGSLMFLEPDTTYEIQLTLTDPDGGEATRELAVRTRRVPALPTSGRTYHVTPGDDGQKGTGTAADPFRGIAAAEAVAQPSDVFLLHAGDYGQARFTRAGQDEGRYIVWRAAGDGDAVFSHIDLTASHVWLEGLTLHKTAETTTGLRAQGSVEDAVITRNRFTGYNYSILLSRDCRNWYIADNTIVGDRDLTDIAEDATMTHLIGGEGIELTTSRGGHTVCYNSISNVADGISYPGPNTDIFGNDIFNVSDDGLELDHAGANTRAWGNRITNVGFNVLSFQPLYGSPVYMVRNQIVGTGRVGAKNLPRIFKFRVQDRFVFVNNTVVTAREMSDYCDAFFSSLSRNNLFISSTDTTPLWLARRSTRTEGWVKYVLPMQRPGPFTDMDYNGYDWGRTDSKAVFRIQDPDAEGVVDFSDLRSFAQATGAERHSLRVHKDEVFESWPIPAGPGLIEPPLLTLKAGSTAVDAGSPLPNISSAFVGAAPDLGAMEWGQPPMHFGPRHTD